MLIDLYSLNIKHVQMYVSVSNTATYNIHVYTLHAKDVDQPAPWRCLSDRGSSWQCLPDIQVERTCPLRKHRRSLWLKIDQWNNYSTTPGFAQFSLRQWDRYFFNMRIQVPHGATPGHPKRFKWDVLRHVWTQPGHPNWQTAHRARTISSLVVENPPNR